MSHQASASEQTLPEGWAARALGILKRRKIDVENYQSKIVKERLFDAMAVPNIVALLRSARDAAGVDEEEVVERLRLDRSTYNRWLRDAVQPHSRMFSGILVVGLRREIDEVELPRNRTIIREAVSRTIGIIREKELGRDRRRPDRPSLSCVRSLMRHPDADALLPDPKGGIPVDTPRVLDALARVVSDQRRKPRGSGITELPAVRAAIKEWADPYVLFRLGLSAEWGYLDDDTL